MAEKIVGVIGGSGLYEMEGLEEVQTISLTTPFGEPIGFLCCWSSRRSEDRLFTPSWKGPPHLPLLP